VQGIDPQSYADEKNPDLPLPWDHIDKGIRKESLKRERNRAHAFQEEPFPEKESPSPARGEKMDSPVKVKISDFAPAEQLENMVVSAEECSHTPLPSYGRRKKKRPLSPVMKVARSRTRLKWIKREEVRFTSHLDVGRTFERTIRRSGIPIAYSEGFHPHQKVAFGPPLPLGFVSNAEYLDIRLTEPYSSAVLYQLNRSLPRGFEFLEGKPILGKSESLSSMINLACYQVRLNLPRDETEKLIQTTLERGNLWVKRLAKQQVKEVNIRGNIRKLECEPSGDQTLVKMHLGMGRDGYARPEEILIYGLGLEQKRVAALLFKRTGLFVTKDKQILTPMEEV